MKIVHQTSTRLVLRTWPIFLWLLGLFGMGMGALVLVTRSPVSTITCQRPEPGLRPSICDKQVSLFGLTLERQPLPDLHWVWLSELEADGVAIYRVMLYTAEGAVPLTAWHSRGIEPKLAALQQIKNFLYNHQEASLQVVYRESRLQLSGWITLTLLGLGIILFAPVVTFIFDKKDGVLTRIQRSPFRRQIERYALHPSCQVVADATLQPSGTLKHVALLLASGEQVRLWHPYYTFRAPSREERKTLALRLQQFLSAPD